MKYKKITFACVLLGLSLYAGVCAATVTLYTTVAVLST